MSRVCFAGVNSLVAGTMTTGTGTADGGDDADVAGIIPTLGTPSWRPTDQRSVEALIGEGLD